MKISGGKYWLVTVVPERMSKWQANWTADAAESGRLIAPVDADPI